jgi:5'-phosphate synthase pdxT subunit
VRIRGFDKEFPGVFIRAPLIMDVWGAAEVLSRFDDRIIMVQQDNLFALSFHPELTNDLRIHEYFLEFI